MNNKLEALGPSAAQNIDQHLLNTVGVEPARATSTELMQAVALIARAQLSQRWVATQAADRHQKSKRVVYLSMEFLMGRTLGNAMAALNLTDEMKAGLAQRAAKIEDVTEREADAALGNGGLGRLASCLRGRRRLGQRRLGPSGLVLSRLDGHAGFAFVWLRHTLRIRHVRAANCEWLPS